MSEHTVQAFDQELSEITKSYRPDMGGDGANASGQFDRSAQHARDTKLAADTVAQDSELMILSKENRNIGSADHRQAPARGARPARDRCRHSLAEI